MSGPKAYEGPVFQAPIDLDLSRNEGRPWALEDSGLAPELYSAVTRYPRVAPLRVALAKRLSVDPARLLPTAGGDDALLRCFMARAGATVVSTTPSFEMIRHYSLQTGGKLVEVEWWDGPFPIQEYLAAGDGTAQMAVVVSPNNPTGGVISADDLRRIADTFELVLLDAAYTEFADEDLALVALELDNILTIRTLSKAFGLAGLRVGYLVGSTELVAEIAGYGNPFSVSSLSARIALSALNDPAPMTAFVEEVRRERSKLTELLADHGAEPFPSQANFVFARFNSPEWVLGAAQSLGIGFRIFPDRDDLKDFVRISLPGDPDEFDRLVASLKTILGPEALIFDMDGVLVDVHQSQSVAIIETAASFGARVTPDDIAEAKAAGNANDDWDLTRRLCLAADIDVPLQLVKNRYERIYQGHGDTPGLKEAERPLISAEDLATLGSRFRLGIVTGRPRSDAEEFLDRFGLTEYFDVVVTKEDAPLKPDPAPVRLALEQLGVDRAWMLGDTRDDLEAARGAGVVPIGVVAPGDDPQQAQTSLVNAAIVLDATSQIMEVGNVPQS